jgi:3-methyl-2-oxobutanoate hydroxymethyltransferase
MLWRRCYSVQLPPQGATAAAAVSALRPDAARKKVTLLDLQALYRTKQPITALTASDYPSACYVEASDAVDLCLVGDSLAMVSCGYPNTSTLPLEEMLYHCRAVARGAKTPFLVADMPYGTYQVSTEQATVNALKLIQQGHMESVKLEGGVEIADMVAKLVSIGVPVLGHIGLKPQQQTAFSGFRVQGKTASSAMQILKDAQAIQAAGAFGVVIEAVPSKLAAYITSKLSIPTIGIGAGPATSGQVLVQADLLGSFNSFLPRFTKRYAHFHDQARDAIKEYSQDVKLGSFPDEERHTYPIKDEEWSKFLEDVD